MTVAAGDAHPIPIYGARYRLAFPIYDNTGSLVTGAAGLDSERSIDFGTFADCTNEATEIATASGMYYLDLTSAEMTAQCVIGIVKTSTTNAKTTPFTLYPVRLPQIRTGTAQAGASSTITLDAGASPIDDYYVGCYVNITNNTPTNAQGQCRMITDYNGSTKVATVDSAWGTNPSSSSTFEILSPIELAAGQLMDQMMSRYIGGAADADEGLRQYRDVFRKMRNKWTNVAGTPPTATFTAYKEDDTTTIFTETLTTASGADGVTGSDPT